MDILNIWMSQRHLKRFENVPEMVKFLEEGGELPPIILCHCDDNEIQLLDGHHRLTAMWLSGKRQLKECEYVLVENDPAKPRFGRITRLIFDNLK